MGMLLTCHIEMRFGDGNAAFSSEFHLNLAKYLKSSTLPHKNVVVFVILLHLPIINKSRNSKSNNANIWDTQNWIIDNYEVFWTP